MVSSMFGVHPKPESGERWQTFGGDEDTAIGVLAKGRREERGGGRQTRGLPNFEFGFTNQGDDMARVMSRNCGPPQRVRATRPSFAKARHE